MNRRNLFKNIGVATVSGMLPAIANANNLTHTPKHVLRIAHITDVHIQGLIGAVRGFERCLHHIQSLEHKPNIIINSGDCIMDAHGHQQSKVKKQWLLFNNVLKSENSLPIYHTIGNHDICCEGNSGHSFEDGKRWAMDEMALNQAYYSFDMAGWHICMLDSVQKKQNGNWYTAQLGLDQSQWLQQDLSSTTLNTLVISHIPILSACVFFDGNNMKNEQWELPGSWMHTDSKQIAEVFSVHKHVKMAVSGHIHLSDRVDYNGVSYFCNGAVSGRWWFGPYQHTPAGYAVIDLYDNGSFTNTYLTYS
jgi:3',5'-cyclic-AMP phosphodiesterase